MNIDWMQLCLNLRSSYKPLSQIAKEVGSDWRHICRLSRGEVHQPKFDVAVKLLDLHYDYCFDKHKNLRIK